MPVQSTRNWHNSTPPDLPDRQTGIDLPAATLYNYVIQPVTPTPDGWPPHIGSGLSSSTVRLPGERVTAGTLPQS